MTDSRPNHIDLQRDFGRMEGKQDAMQERMDRLEKVVKDGFENLSKKLDTTVTDHGSRLEKLEATGHRQRGAFGVVEAIATALLAIGSAIIGAVSGTWFSH